MSRGDLKPVYGTGNAACNEIVDKGEPGCLIFLSCTATSDAGFRAKIGQISEFPRKTLFPSRCHDPHSRTQFRPGKHRLQDPQQSAGPPARHQISRAPRGRRRSHADRDLPDRQHRRADRRADAGAAVRGAGGARIRGIPRARATQGRRPADALRVPGRAIRPGHAERVRRPVRGRFARIGRGDDEGAAGPRPGLHAHGRLQAAHQPLRVPGPRRVLPALRLRTGRQVRHQGDRDGDHPRIAHRRDPRGAARDRQPDRRHAADRHAQHAELRAAETGGQAAGLSRC